MEEEKLPRTMIEKERTLKLVSVAEDIIPIENQRVIKKFLASLQAMSTHLERFQAPLITPFHERARYSSL